MAQKLGLNTTYKALRKSKVFLIDRDRGNDRDREKEREREREREKKRKRERERERGISGKNGARKFTFETSLL